VRAGGRNRDGRRAALPSFASPANTAEPTSRCQLLHCLLSHFYGLTTTQHYRTCARALAHCCAARTTRAHCDRMGAGEDVRSTPRRSSLAQWFHPALPPGDGELISMGRALSPPLPLGSSAYRLSTGNVVNPGATCRIASSRHARHINSSLLCLLRLPHLLRTAFPLTPPPPAHLNRPQNEGRRGGGLPAARGKRAGNA